MDITDLDPLQYGLIFERFLNPERISMPDIDIDFHTRRRGEVIQYVTEKYGREQVALEPLHQQRAHDLTNAIYRETGVYRRQFRA